MLLCMFSMMPWSTSKVVVGLAGSSGATPCAKPTISYKNEQITTDCDYY
ncbi:MAG: hypothetical protein IKT00_05055 [Prevotella sp.]|nr:hypothetical protein [Prevotella sp.]